MDLKLTYFVTSGIGAIALDEAFDLNGALSHACQVIFEGYENVTINDHSGNSIHGEELAACCRHEKTLMPNLQTY